MIAKPESLWFIRKFVFIGVGDQLIPDIETMLFQLPELLFTEVRNWLPVDCLFGW
jgi:hypothetical protein